MKKIQRREFFNLILDNADFLKKFDVGNSSFEKLFYSESYSHQSNKTYNRHNLVEC